MFDSLTGNQWAGLTFFVILAGSLVGSLLRTNIGQSLRHASIWVLIFLGAIAAYGMWGDIRQTIAPLQTVTEGGQISLPRRADGHYYLMAQVNGQPLEFMVDTGASQIVLTRKDAAKIGLDPDGLAYIGTANTANGPVATAQVFLETLSLEGVSATNIRAVVNDGDMDTSLLGMSFLDRFSRIEISGGQLILTP